MLVYIYILPTLTPRMANAYGIRIYQIKRKDVEEESEKTNKKGNDRTPVRGKQEDQLGVVRGGLLLASGDGRDHGASPKEVGTSRI